MVQSSFAMLAGFFHQKCNLLKARLIIHTYQNVRLLPPGSLVVNQSVLRSREATLLCNQVVSGTSNDCYFPESPVPGRKESEFGSYAGQLGNGHGVR